MLKFGTDLIVLREDKSSTPKANNSDANYSGFEFNRDDRGMSTCNNNGANENVISAGSSNSFHTC